MAWIWRIEKTNFTSYSNTLINKKWIFPKETKSTIGTHTHNTKPRNLLSAEAKAYTDGRMYHAITAGRGVMGSYAGQIPDEKTRWAVVNYVRTLQR